VVLCVGYAFLAVITYFYAGVHLMVTAAGGEG
jgi:hypothetical protein